MTAWRIIAETSSALLVAYTVVNCMGEAREIVEWVPIQPDGTVVVAGVRYRRV